MPKTIKRKDWIMINGSTPIWQLTVAEFREIIHEGTQQPATPEPAIADHECVYGIAGLAELIGASKTTAQKLKSSGELNTAITQIGRKIIINKKIALQILKSKSL